VDKVLLCVSMSKVLGKAQLGETSCGLETVSLISWSHENLLNFQGNAGAEKVIDSQCNSHPCLLSLLIYNWKHAYYNLNH
jgi:hypothetical protein